MADASRRTARRTGRLDFDCGNIGQAEIGGNDRAEQFLPGHDTADEIADEYAAYACRRNIGIRKRRTRGLRGKTLQVAAGQYAELSRANTGDVDFRAHGLHSMHALPRISAATQHRDRPRGAKPIALPPLARRFRRNLARAQTKSRCSPSPILGSCQQRRPQAARVLRR